MTEQPVPRVIFFGMLGDFSTPSLSALLAQGVEVCAVVLPAAPLPGRSAAAIVRREPTRQSRLSLQMAGGSDVITLAERHHLPVWDVYRMGHPDTLAVLSAYRTDVICVACFPRRIPRAILDLPRLGSLNVHPGLLPANRGPLPLFWTLRLGERQAGVTIHLLTDKLDSGDVVAQETVALDDGMSYEELEARCARRGAALLARSVWDLHEGRARRTAQDEAASSYYPAPGEQDFVVPAQEWDARRVYNFVRGLRNWGQPLTLLSGGETLRVSDATSYSLDFASEEDRGSIVGNERVVYCREGWVRVRVG
ncbi:MAG: hypothetical protein J2P36_26985 [Ktedonobacteraceae bacterium]|nr:hypothetical protein [Ktedonobacteraceae bacterium]